MTDENQNDAPKQSDTPLGDQVEKQVEAENPPAADSKDEHLTPGANPVNDPDRGEQGPDGQGEDTVTQVETPGGTTVTEGRPGDLEGRYTSTENPGAQEGDFSSQTGR